MAAAGNARQFCNATQILVPGPEPTGAGSPYPSIIEVSGVGAAVKVTATLDGIHHTWASDMQFLLVGPTGGKSLILSNALGGARLVDVTLTLDDDAPTGLSRQTVVPASGSYQPSAFSMPPEAPAPAPAQPWDTTLAVFAGTNPNGTWMLYAWDRFVSLDHGDVRRGWCLSITSDNVAPVANAGGPYSGVEGSLITLDGTASTGASGNIASYAWTFGDGTSGSGPTPQHAYADDGTYTVTLVVTDVDGVASEAARADVTVSNAAPSLGAITGLPAGPVPTGTVLTLSADFTDAGTLDTHTGTVVWDDGATVAAVIGEEGGSGTMSASRTLSPGVYAVTFTVNDDDGGSATVSTVGTFIVVYDPDGGFVTGGGWIASPAGAYTAAPSLVGRATFGFVSKYQPGATLPTGNTSFIFHAGDLRFHSTRYDWLVVAGSKAQFRGEGSVNGVAGYQFILTANDGDASPSGGPDRFRIKITGPGGVVYDNGVGAPDNMEASTALGGGEIAIKR